MYACACDYAHLCHSVGLHLCIHEHVIMHIYVMHSAITRTPQESYTIYLAHLIDYFLMERTSCFGLFIWSPY